MPHLKHGADGHLLHNAAGHLIHKCKEGPTNPCDPDPSILLTVTGASGSVNWCGRTWNLPGDSGMQQYACPGFYDKNKGTSASTITGTITTVSYKKFAKENWIFTGNSGLNLARGYQFTSLKYYSPYSTIVNKYGNAGNTLYLAPVSLGSRFTWQYSFGWLTGLTTASLGGLISGESRPTYSDGYLTNSYFGSFTSGGITYAWAKGAGW